MFCSEEQSRWAGVWMLTDQLRSRYMFITKEEMEQIYQIVKNADGRKGNSESSKIDKVENKRMSEYERDWGR